ncbi:MAG: PAS domain S-box protein [Planctomycetaceae bacterium]|nr:PAS domain S-box protein [Planctomycetaceae bacterium]MCB9952142.1 PAS domain S-box protein [Planctomycetaceae bacterium]
MVEPLDPSAADNRPAVDEDFHEQFLAISRGLLNSFHIWDRQSVYKAVTTQIRDLFDCEDVTYFSVDEDNPNSLRPLSQIPEQPIKQNVRIDETGESEGSLVGRMASTAPSMILNGDEIESKDRHPDHLQSRDLYSVLAAQLMNRKGGRVGLLLLQNKQISKLPQRAKFSDSDKAVVDLLAIQFASLLENYQLQQGTRKLIDEMQVARSNLEAVEVILDRGIKLLQADFAKLTLWSRKSNRLKVVGSKELGQKVQHEENQFEDSNSLIRQLWDSAIKITNLGQLGRPDHDAWLDSGTKSKYADAARCHLQSKSSVSIVLRVHRQPIGVLHLESFKAGFFDENDRQILKTLAQYISTAIQSRNEPWTVDQDLHESDWDMWSFGHTTGLYHSLVRLTPLVMWRKDLKGVFVWVNDAFCKTVGKSRKEIIGNDDFQLFPEDKAKYFREGDRLAATQGYFEDPSEPYSLPGDDQDRFIHVVKFPFFDQLGKVAGTQGIYLDVISDKFRQLFNQSPIGFHELNHEGKIEHVNAAECELLGYNEKELKGRDYWELSTRQDQEILKRLITGQLDGSVPEGESHPVNLRKKTGEIVPVVINSRRSGVSPKIHASRPQFSSGLVCAIREVSSGIDIEEALRYPDSRYLSRIKELTLPVFCLDRELRVTFANPSYLRRDKLTEECAVGKTGIEIYGESGKPYHEDSKRVLQTGKVLDKVENHTIDGRSVLVRVLKFPIRNALGEVVGVQGVLWNYEEQEKAKKLLSEALDAAREDYRQIVEQASEGIFQSQFNGKIIAANPALAQMLGFDSEQELLLSEDAGQDRFAEPEEQRLYFSNVLSAKEGDTLKMEYRLKGGRGRSARWVRESVQRRHDRKMGGRLVGFVEDIHDYKMSLEAKGELVRMLSHQLRSPAWQAYERVNKLVQEKDPDGDLAKGNASLEVQNLATIRGLTSKTRGVAWSTDMMSKLSEVERFVLDPRKKTRFSPGLLAKMALESARDTQLILKSSSNFRKKMGRSNEVPSFEICPLSDSDAATSKRIDGTKGLVEQIVGNVVENAYKYSMPDSTIQITCLLENRNVILTVRNLPLPGLEMDAETARRCREKEWRSPGAEKSDADGTGLGLWIVDKVMKAHGGALIVDETNVDGWNSIHLRFPLT